MTIFDLFIAFWFPALLFAQVDIKSSFASSVGCDGLWGLENSANFSDDISATIIATACSDPTTIRKSVFIAEEGIFDVHLSYPNGSSHTYNQQDLSYTGNSSELSFVAIASALQNFSTSLPDDTVRYLLPAFYNGTSAPLGAGWCDLQTWQAMGATLNIYNLTSTKPVVALSTDQKMYPLVPASTYYDQSIAQHEVQNLSKDWTNSVVQYWDLSTNETPPPIVSMSGADWLHQCAALFYMPDAGTTALA